MALFGVDIKDLSGAVGAIGSVAKDIRAAITGKEVIDATAAAQIEAQLAQIDAAAEQAQAKVNEVEAANPNVFISGWRPFIGWVCGFSFVYDFLVRPLLQGIWKLDMPGLDSNVLMSLTFGMLGIAGMRTAEKFKGVARS